MRYILFIYIIFISCSIEAQYAPAAGKPGSNAISADSSIFVSWAHKCTAKLGYQNILDSSLGLVSAGNESFALGKAMENPTLSLGDGGYAILEFPQPITNEPGYDFAVFENAFIDSFLELATVEVSSDGINFTVFPAVCLTDTSKQLGAFGLTNPTHINNLAGKFVAGYGTPFDLDELKNTIGLDINHITHVKVKDVVGILSHKLGTIDSQGNLINDPWPTPFISGGFDLDAVGVIHQKKPNGLVPLSKQVLQIYPNPAQSEIYIEGNMENQPFSIVNILGKEMGFQSNGRIIDISNLEIGVYFIKSGNEYIKFVKH